MSGTQIISKGVVHGKNIELDREPGLPDGQLVTVTVRSAGDAGIMAAGEGLRRSAGAWADDAEALDVYLTWNREQRKRGRLEI